MDAPAVTPYFGLRKTWLDPGPGIALVQAHYTWSDPGAAPDWADAEQVVLAPEDGPLRAAVLEVPRLAGDFQLHHFFFVVGADDRAASPVFTEDIVSTEVTCTDATGDLTAAGLVWSSDGAPPNYTSTVMDGLPFETLGDAPGEGSLYEFVRAQPLPHVFRGRVWGVRGTSIRYALHLIRHGRPDPAQDGESWDDNGGRGWVVAL
ncbi:hypothetical protein M1L60_31480 [Actinoplanes sp. TRM 88003]|uniref:Uncharacterized protein n=1 Tax=Paractinoplanes aksuensis TaxID=2939490 RepID=A0ABT1DZS9_9ACTN|nr:hypothetical protein [Actinoplanes aksuensis]MCO8275111.1 hypothetical protein [Actinoplanes aksuensis]